MQLPNKNTQGEAVAVALRSVVITPTDGADIPNFESLCRLGIWVGTGGNITGRLVGDATDRTWKNVPSGTHMSYFFRRISATGTTAADMLGHA